MRKLMMLLLPFCCQLAHAQEPAASKGYFRKNNYFDASLSAGNAQGAAALSWNHFHLIGKKGRFKIGYGLRFTSYAGRNKDYITAPAKITSRQTGPQVLFSETYEESLDTVNFTSPQVNAFNLSIHLEYAVFRKLDVGFNIDAAGFSFGGQRTGDLHSELRPGNLAVQQEARPTPYNLLLVSDNDIGTLNSELYVRYWLTPVLGIKTGLTFLFTEYTTKNKLIYDNDRFRNKAAMFMLGITYCPFKSNKLKNDSYEKR